MAPVPDLIAATNRANKCFCGIMYATVERVAVVRRMKPVSLRSERGIGGINKNWWLRQIEDKLHQDSEERQSE
jgi:hypothetical protein